MTRETIRPARPSDLRHLRGIEESGGALFVELFGDQTVPALLATPPTGGERDDQPGFLLVADVDGEVVGFAHVDTRADYDGLAHLEQLSVLPAHGRRGVGTRLVEAAMEEARWAGFTELSLCTYRDVPFNGPFYARLGFREVARPTAFQQRLHERELELGLGRNGVRVVMSCALRRPVRAQVTDE